MAYHYTGNWPMTPITPIHSPHPSAGSARSRTPGQLSLHDYRKMQVTPSPPAIPGQKTVKKKRGMSSLQISERFSAQSHANSGYRSLQSLTTPPETPSIEPSMGFTSTLATANAPRQQPRQTIYPTSTYPEFVHLQSPDLLLQHSPPFSTPSLPSLSPASQLVASTSPYQPLTPENFRSFSAPSAASQKTLPFRSQQSQPQSQLKSSEQDQRYLLARENRFSTQPIPANTGVESEHFESSEFEHFDSGELRRPVSTQGFFERRALRTSNFLRPRGYQSLPVEPRSRTLFEGLSAREPTASEVALLRSTPSKPLRQPSQASRAETGSGESGSRERYFNSAKRLPRPDTLVKRRPAPLRLIASNNEAFSEAEDSSTNASTFSLSKYTFPQPPAVPPQPREFLKFTLPALASRIEQSAESKSPSVRYSGVAFDIVNPHTSFRLSNVESASVNIDPESDSEDDDDSTSAEDFLIHIFDVENLESKMPPRKSKLHDSLQSAHRHIFGRLGRSLSRTRLDEEGEASQEGPRTPPRSSSMPPEPGVTPPLEERRSWHFSEDGQRVEDEHGELITPSIAAGPTASIADLANIAAAREASPSGYSLRTPSPRRRQEHVYTSDELPPTAPAHLMRLGTPARVTHSPSRSEPTNTLPLRPSPLNPRRETIPNPHGSVPQTLPGPGRGRTLYRHDDDRITPRPVPRSVSRSRGSPSYDRRSRVARQSAFVDLDEKPLPALPHDVQAESAARVPTPPVRNPRRLQSSQADASTPVMGYSSLWHEPYTPTPEQVHADRILSHDTQRALLADAATRHQQSAFNPVAGPSGLQNVARRPNINPPDPRAVSPLEEDFRISAYESNYDSQSLAGGDDDELFGPAPPQTRHSAVSSDYVTDTTSRLSEPFQFASYETQPTVPQRTQHTTPNVNRDTTDTVISRLIQDYAEPDADGQATLRSTPGRSTQPVRQAISRPPLQSFSGQTLARDANNPIETGHTGYLNGGSHLPERTSFSTFRVGRNNRRVHIRDIPVIELETHEDFQEALEDLTSQPLLSRDGSNYLLRGEGVLDRIEEVMGARAREDAEAILDHGGEVLFNPPSRRRSQQQNFWSYPDSNGETISSLGQEDSAETQAQPDGPALDSPITFANADDHHTQHTASQSSSSETTTVARASGHRYGHSGPTPRRAPPGPSDHDRFVGFAHMPDPMMNGNFFERSDAQSYDDTNGLLGLLSDPIPTSKPVQKPDAILADSGKFGPFSDIYEIKDGEVASVSSDYTHSQASDDVAAAMDDEDEWETELNPSAHTSTMADYDAGPDIQLYHRIPAMPISLPAIPKRARLSDEITRPRNSQLPGFYPVAELSSEPHDQFEHMSSNTPRFGHLQDDIELGRISRSSRKTAFVRGQTSLEPLMLTRRVTPRLVSRAQNHSQSAYMLADFVIYSCLTYLALFVFPPLLLAGGMMDGVLLGRVSKRHKQCGVVVACVVLFVALLSGAIGIVIHVHNMD